MALDLAELLGEHWAAYVRAHRQQLCTAHYRAVRRVLACRTPKLGGRLYRCGACRKQHYAYHSCNHRNSTDLERILTHLLVKTVYTQIPILSLSMPCDV